MEQSAKLTRLKKAQRAFVASLVVEVREMAKGGPNPTFDAAAWIAQWLRMPHPALNGQAPGNFLDTAVHRQTLLNLIRQQASGAYA